MFTGSFTYKNPKYMYVLTFNTYFHLFNHIYIPFVLSPSYMFNGTGGINIKINLCMTKKNVGKTISDRICDDFEPNLPPHI